MLIAAVRPFVVDVAALDNRAGAEAIIDFVRRNDGPRWRVDERIVIPESAATRLVVALGVPAADKALQTDGK